MPMTADEARGVLDAELERGRGVIAEAASLEDLDEAEVSLLGRKAPFSSVQRRLRDLPEEDRRDIGRRTNEVRETLQSAIAERRAALEARREVEVLARDAVDRTLPGRRPRPGSLNPLTVTEYDIVDVFVSMGYSVVEGPEIETDWYNFEALNIPPDHPARTEKDTFYLASGDLLLRTETSAMQIRTMEVRQPPVYIVAPGRVFRQENWDATHSPMFHQVEGLAVDEGISFAHLKGTLESFVHALFGEDRRVRLTPSFFPFVEPGAQVEVSCFRCGGAGCATCKGTGWIEILGAGMVHPNVLENVGYDSERYTGFAFGMGIERVAMLRYGIGDIRLFFDGDVRFLEQFESAG